MHTPTRRQNHGRDTRLLRRPTAALLLAAAAISATPASAQNDPPPPPVEPETLTPEQIRERIDAMFEEGEQEDAPAQISPALRAELDAAYLTDDERRALRTEHGLWTDDDLTDPARRAEAALIAGAPAAPVFDAGAPDRPLDPVLTARALLARGEPGLALERLADAATIEAHSIRAHALFDLGRFDDADAAVQPIVDRMTREPVEDTRQLAAGVRALMLRSTLRGSARAEGGDFRTLMRIIENARDNLDRLSWRIRVAEAELLYDKHNRADAAAALAEALALNPRAADALALLGRIAVDNFAFDEAERVASELDAIAAEFDTISPDAAGIRARARLRQRDPDAARAILAEARETYPTHRGLLALHAAATACAFDENATDALLTEFDALAPGAPLAHFEVGAALAEARQYDTAADELDTAARRLPNWSHPWIELGLVLIQAGRDDDAERYLEQAVALDPFNARAKNSLELVRGLDDFATIESDHFVVRYMPGIDEILAREMLPVLERIHARVAADPAKTPGGIGHEPRDKTLIELMPSHRWFSVRITGMTRVHTMAAATGPVIAMESPQEGPNFTVGPFDWPRVIQHEYTHTVTLSRTRNRVPHWFTEATAVFNEDAPRDERTWRLLAKAFETGGLFDLDKINTAFVRPEKPTDRGQAYAQGHWMVQFMVDRWGPEVPVRLMDRYAAGEPEASALEAELGVSKDEFMDLFLDWARADLRRVGLVLPENVPTIPEMLDADRREAENTGGDPDAVGPDLAFVERWQAQYPDHPQLPELLVSLKLMDADTGDDSPRLPEDTVESLAVLADVLPIAETPHRLLARHHLAGDTPAEAIPHLEFLDAREQHSPAFAIELARLYSSTGDLASARAKAERAARIAPFDADIREFAARVTLKSALNATGEFRQSAFADAERHIEALTKIEPDVELHARRLERLRAMAAAPPAP